MYTIEERYVLVNQQNVFVKHLKQTKHLENHFTLVLLHDSLGCVTLWRDWPDMLANSLNCDVVVYDRIGYGQSDKMLTTVRPRDYLKQEADFLNLLLGKLNLSHICTFGHSDGASIALLFAALYPNKTICTIAEAAHVFVEDITLQGVREAQIAYETTNLKDRLVKYHGDRVDDIMKAWVDTWLDPSYRDWSVVQDMKNITAPLLFIQGMNDEYGTLEQVSVTLDNVRGVAQSKIFDNIGHTPHKENKEETLEVITSFLTAVVEEELKRF